MLWRQALRIQESGISGGIKYEDNKRNKIFQKRMDAVFHIRTFISSDIFDSSRNWLSGMDYSFTATLE